MKTLKLSTLLLFGAILLLTGCDKDKDNDPIVVNSVVITPATLELNLGQTEQLTAKVSPDNADDKTVMWSSANQTIATVDASGKVTAVGLGQTTITVTAGGKSGNCTVTVKASTPPGDIDMNGKTTIQVKEAIQAALDAGITEFKLTGNIANSGIDGDILDNNNPFYKNTLVTKVDLSGVIGWTAVELDGNKLTVDNMVGLPGYAFFGCSALQEVILPAEVKALGIQAFSNCKSLTTVNLENVTHVGVVAFSSCAALTSVALPEAIAIYGEAFGSTNLTTVDLPKVTAISVGSFTGNGINGSFAKCKKLTAISAPLLTDAGNGTFSGCDILSTITIPCMKAIGENTFYGCKSLSTVSFEKVEAVGKNAFRACSATVINLPKATTIEAYAFLECGALTTLKLPAATTFDNYIVSACNQLTRIEMTAAGDFGGIGGGSLDNMGVFENAFNPSVKFNSTNCELVLNTDKQSGGAASPTASGNSWASGTIWKSITFK